MLQKVFRTADPAPKPTPDTVRVVLPEARKLRKHRAASNLTQEQVGAAIGVSGFAISSWEIGSSMPGKLNLQKLRDYLAKHDAPAPAPATPPKPAANATDDLHILPRHKAPALRFTGALLGSREFPPIGRIDVYRTKGGNIVGQVTTDPKLSKRPVVWHGSNTEFVEWLDKLTPQSSTTQRAIGDWAATLGFTVYEDIA
tara:strand:+ start:491 stop:1087 length:597 start_codon:yes stop_codon:yes gene_type:complete